MGDRISYLAISVYVIGYFVYTQFGNDDAIAWCNYYYLWEKLTTLLLFICIIYPPNSELPRSLVYATAIMHALRLVFEVMDAMGASESILHRVSQTLSFSMISMGIFMVFFLLTKKKKRGTNRPFRR